MICDLPRLKHPILLILAIVILWLVLSSPPVGALTTFTVLCYVSLHMLLMGNLLKQVRVLLIVLFSRAFWTTCLIFVAALLLC
jgi:hypothetical protein